MSKTAVPPQVVAKMAASVAAMPLAQKEQVIDEIFELQPIVLAQPVTLTRLTPRREVRNAAFEFVMIAFKCLEKDFAGEHKLTEADVERHVEQNVKMWRFLEQEREEDYGSSLAITMESYPEPALFAYLVGRLLELQVEDPPVVLNMKTTCDACVDLKWGRP